MPKWLVQTNQRAMSLDRDSFLLLLVDGVKIAGKGKRRLYSAV